MVEGGEVSWDVRGQKEDGEEGIRDLHSDECSSGLLRRRSTALTRRRGRRSGVRRWIGRVRSPIYHLYGC